LKGRVLARRNDTLRRTLNSVGIRNLRNTCERQLAHALLDLRNLLGRTPSIEDAEASLGESVARAVVHTYGTWNNALASIGIAHRMRYGKYDVNDLIDAFRAWVGVHGNMPSHRSLGRGDRVPAMPSAKTVMRTLGVDTYPEAMRQMAALLGIVGGRYGLPPKKASA
jgi:hypothetical protein